MSYTKPAGNNVDFEIKSYSPPTGNVVDIDFGGMVITTFLAEGISDSILGSYIITNGIFAGEGTADSSLTSLILRLISDTFAADSTVEGNFDSLIILLDSFNADGIAEGYFDSEIFIISSFAGNCLTNTNFEHILLDHNKLPYLYWNDKDLDNLYFENNYYKWIEKHYEQFLQGEHIVTKAYENGDNDYLGFTDDYDFCWGPVNEGEPLAEYVRDYNDNGQLIIKAQEYGPDNGRLWGVYTKSEGEIYLLKANEDLTAWERHEQLTFVPSGSRRATIEFKPDGHYELAVEFIAAGNSTYEIWVLSYPYEGDNIRQVADGTEPQLTSDFDNNPLLFYSDNEQYNLYYREQANNYGTANKINIVFEPERQLHFRYATKGIKPTSMGVGDHGYILVFYKRDDDYKPYKYVMTDILDVLNGPLYIENYELDNVALDNVEWVEIIVTELENNTESYELDNVTLENINWVDITALISGDGGSNVDSYNLGNVELNNINWVDITAATSENNVDSYEFGSIGIDSILWVEV